jgi:RNA polymerase sigma factor (sigma-70 family)
VRTEPTPEELALLAQVIAQVARAGRLAPQDREDFAQSVQLKMVERRYDVFARFGGRSSLRTYLTVVVRRLLLDWRNETKGKWRTSAVARRLGPSAVLLERLVYRDGYLPHEAVAIMAARGEGDPATLAGILDRLPQRQPRSEVSDESVEPLVASPFVDPVETEQARRARQHVRGLLALAIKELPAEERWLIAARYQRARSIQEVARALDVDPKALYRRVDRALRSLRRSLYSAGVFEFHAY